MQKTDVSEIINEDLKNRKKGFSILIQGSFEENAQWVAVDFFNTPIELIEPAMGFAMHQNDTLLKGVLGGINAEFEFYRQE